MAVGTPALVGGQHVVIRRGDEPSRIHGSLCFSHPPALVLPNGQFEMTANIAAVLNSVYAQHSHHAAVASIFGGSNARLIVAYYKNRSLGARLIRARH